MKNVLLPDKENVMCHENFEYREKFFVEFAQILSNKTAKILEKLALRVYPVHAVLLQIWTQSCKWLIVNELAVAALQLVYYSSSKTKRKNMEGCKVAICLSADYYLQHEYRFRTQLD